MTSKTFSDPDVDTGIYKKAKNPLRIFLSYGHDTNQELAWILREDLQKRGHEVRIDKSDIKFGDDWRRKITDCILDSQRVLSLLSKFSTRDPGVCLDEIAIAIGTHGGNIQSILVESETEVKPPQSISHIQWLDMHDWKVWKDKGPEEWETWYQEKLSEIIRVIESDESLRFAGEIKTLEGYLKPVFSGSRLSQLLRKRFVGRVWLFDEIERWREMEHQNSRIFWIMGLPGTGKSAIVAHLAHYGKDKVIAAQFCEYNKPAYRDPARIVRTLAFQIATRLPDYRKLLLIQPEIADLDKKNASELFDYLLASPLRLVINGDRQRYLIAIDALDEAGDSGRNELVEMLAQNVERLPEWIGIVVTSRPEFDVITPFRGLNPVVLDTGTDSNRNDICNYLRQQLEKDLASRADENRIVEQILQKSEGVFLYAECVCDDIRQGRLSLDHPDQFPNGLSGYYTRYFQRLFPNYEQFQKEIRPALRAILAAHEPLPLRDLENIFSWKEEVAHDFVAHLGSFFTTSDEGGVDVIRPYHKSLTDWLVTPSFAGPYFVSLREGHDLLATAGWSEYKTKGPTKMSGYFRQYLPYHLLEMKRYDDLISLLTNREYFIQSWQTREFLVKSWWAAIEGSSEIRLPDVYKNVIRFPFFYSRVYLSSIASLLADTGYVQSSGSIHRYLNLYFRILAEKKNRQVAVGNLGYIALLKGQFPEALGLFEKQEKICRSLSDIEGLIVVLGNKGTAYYKLDMLDNALACYQEQEALCIASGDNSNLRMSIGNQGNVFFDNEQFEKAMEFYKRQYALCEESADIRGMSHSTGNQGNVFFRLGQFDEALLLYQKCEQFCTKILYKEGLQRALGDQAKVCLAKRDFSKALELIGKQEDLCRTIDSSRSLGECLRLKAQLFEERNQFDAAIKVYETIRKTYTALNDFYGLSDTIECLGLVYLKKGELDTAARLFVDLEKMAKKENNVKKQVEAVIDQGLIFAIKGEYQKAFGYYETAENTSQAKKDLNGHPFLFGMQYALSNKADVLSIRGDLRKSLELHAIQSDICRKTNNSAGLLYGLLGLAMTNRQLGNYQEALSFLAEHTQLSEKNYQYFHAQHSLGLTGNILLKTGDPNAAKEQYFRQLRICNNLGYHYEGVESYLHIALIDTLFLKNGKDLRTVDLPSDSIRMMNAGDYISRLLWCQTFAFNLERDLDIFLDMIIMPGGFSESLESEEGKTDRHRILSGYYPLMDELDQFYQTCEKECRRIGFSLGLQHVIGRRGLLYALKNESGMALPLFEEQSAISKQIGYISGEEVALGRLAKCYFALKKTDEALRFANMQNDLCRDKKVPEGEQESEFLKRQFT
ncbi:MAG: TIR domain-containing protein [Methanoregula sp.]